jgi:hypothetical protein
VSDLLHDRMRCFQPSCPELERVTSGPDKPLGTLSPVPRSAARAVTLYCWTVDHYRRVALPGASPRSLPHNICKQPRSKIARRIERPGFEIFNRCRLHGGADGSGAPLGNKNAVKHSRYTKAAILERKQIRYIKRMAKAFLKAHPPSPLERFE